MLAAIAMNGNPQEYRDVKVFTSSPGYGTADVDIKDFEYTPRGVKPAADVSSK